MIKTIIIFLLVCQSIYCDVKKKYINLAHDAENKFIKYIEATSNLEVQATGGGMMFDVDLITLYFVSPDLLTVNQARELYVKVAEKFLSIINSNPEIRPFLHNFPFTIKNFDFSITFRDSGHRPAKEYVSLVYHRDDKDIIYYKGYDADAEDFVTLQAEPYSEALKIVQNEKSEAQTLH